MVTGRHKVISLWDSFHGASLDAIAAGGEQVFRKGMGPLMPGVERIPPPTTYRGIFGDDGNDIKYAEYLEYIIEKRRRDWSFYSGNGSQYRCPVTVEGVLEESKGNMYTT